MPTRVSRVPLDRTRVVAAAIALADRDGLEALSMRSLAGELGVVPMALYKHVGDKDDLLAAMFDSVITEYAEPSEESPWQRAVRERVLSARATLHQHPWVRTVVEGRGAPTLGALAHMDAVTGDFLRGGISPDLTHYALHAVGSRIWGFNPDAFSGRAPEPGDADPIDLARFPHVAAIVADATTRNPSQGCDDDAEFAFTLDLLLDAVERLHLAGWVSRPAPGRSRRVRR